MNLLALVAETLSGDGLPHALVGGMALAAHGLARATLDADVLVLAPAAVDPMMWADARSAGTIADIRHGAADLVLLKIHAGGPQDLVDAERLLTAPDRERIVADVELRIDALPAGCRRDWERVKSADS